VGGLEGRQNHAAVAEQAAEEPVEAGDRGLGRSVGGLQQVTYGGGGHGVEHGLQGVESGLQDLRGVEPEARHGAGPDGLERGHITLGAGLAARHLADEQRWQVGAGQGLTERGLEAGPAAVGGLITLGRGDGGLGAEQRPDAGGLLVQRVVDDVGSAVHRRDPEGESTAQQGKVKRLCTGYAAELIGLDPGNSTIRCGRDDSCEHQGHCADQPQRVDLAHPQLLSYLT